LRSYGTVRAVIIVASYFKNYMRIAS
jgi:hypothetical protein